jgi:hypothetical protein
LRSRDRLGIDIVLAIHNRSTSDPHKRRIVFGGARQRAGGQASALDARADVGDGPTSITGALAGTRRGGFGTRRRPPSGKNLKGVGTMGRDRRSVFRARHDASRCDRRLRCTGVWRSVGDVSNAPRDRSLYQGCVRVRVI